jgi:hypothetical protein
VPNFEVISAVSQTLQEFLTSELSTLSTPPIVEVSDLIVIPPTNPPRLSIFLFEIGEDPSARNRPRVRETLPTGDVALKKPPMALLLRYLLTAFSGDRFTDHRILGRVVQALYDQAILSGPLLKGPIPPPEVLVGTNQALKVTMAPLSLDERARVWYSIQKPYRLSVSYEVRVVNLDSERTTQTKPVTQRTADFATLER